METLFDDSEVFQKERPTTLSEKQERQMFIDIANDIINSGYSDVDSGFPEYDIETIADDITNLSLYNTGFEIAKELEDDGNVSYNFSGDFIEFLDSLNFRRYDAIQKNVASWVIAHTVEPNLKVGTKLKLNTNLGHTYKTDDIVYITGYDEKHARYMINKEYPANGGTLFAYELVESNCEVINQ